MNSIIVHKCVINYVPINLKKFKKNTWKYLLGITISVPKKKQLLFYYILILLKLNIIYRIIINYGIISVYKNYFVNFKNVSFFFYIKKKVINIIR